MQAAAAVAPLVVEAEAVLEQIVVINAEGLLIVQTIWLTDRARGRRATHTQTVSGEAQLIRALGQLLPTMIPRDPFRWPRSKNAD